MLTASPREFPISPRQFDHIRTIVKERTGIHLSESKFEMVYSRLAKRLRALGLPNFTEYLRLLDGSDPAELAEFVSAITTNLTHFFREEHHFDFLGEELLPALLEDRTRGRPIRIWSAGCSVGMEPYSIAMVAHEVVPEYRLPDLEIIASDIDRRVLEEARRGVYSIERAESISSARLRRWFERGVGRNEGAVRVRDSIRHAVEFVESSLMDRGAVSGPFDAIFCRNVLIYFDVETQRQVLARFADQLDLGGVLFLGHSESMYRKSDRYDFLGKTTFRKRGRAEA
ncbi:MAG: protein-glutamate O-methyltransferase CheR [Planctomycetota bacterium]